MNHRLRVLPLIGIALVAAACASTKVGGSGSSLTIATWNLEHLAEKNGSGCRPRTDADYLALKAFAETLNADVIALQEVESLAAAQRVFPPEAYTVVMEERMGSGSAPPCYGAPDLHLNRQAVGFAIRNGLPFERVSDLVALQTGDPNLRSGVDITVKPKGAPALRLLAIHLKSGCAGGGANPSCETLAQQAAILTEWAAARGSAGEQFVVLGDFNRRLALPGDAIWASLDDPPGPADLSIAAGTQGPMCDPRYTSFIDHVLLDQSTSARAPKFREWTYGGAHLSDHCPVGVILNR